MTLDETINLAYIWSKAFYNAEECEDLLLARGCKAFLKFREFQDQFLDDPNQREQHRIFYGERCRQAAINSPVICYHPVVARAKFYDPPVLTEGRLALARLAGYQDVPTWIATENPSPVEIEPDPLVRAMARRLRPLENVSKPTQRLYDIFSARAQVAIQAEVQRDFPSRRLQVTAEQRQSILQELASRYLLKLGFRLSGSRLVNYVAFDLELNKALNLRWSVGESKYSFFTDFPVPTESTLHIRNKAFPNRLSKAGRQECYLIIPFTLLVEGVEQSYRLAHDVGQLDAILKAHFTLLEWTIPRLQSAVRECFG